MMTPEQFDLSRLVPATQPPEDVISSDRYGPKEDQESEVDEVESGPTLRCSICGTPEEQTMFLPVGYANPVCGDCDDLAVDSSGEPPWVGWKPGNAPDREPGVIPIAPDAGANPVYIAGAKCWRRYRFGGHVTRRDAFDCNSVEEFYERHRNEPRWIHAFNTAQPAGVDVSREEYDYLSSHIEEVEADLAHVANMAEGIVKGSPTDTKIRCLQESIEQLDEQVQGRLPEREGMGVEEYAEAVLRAAKYERKREKLFLELCKRYYGETS